MKKVFFTAKSFAGIRAACRKIQAHFKWGGGRAPALFLRGWRFWKGGSAALAESLPAHFRPRRAPESYTTILSGGSREHHPFSKKLSISGLCVGFSGGFGLLELRHIPSGGRRNGHAWRHGSASHGRGGLRFLDCLFLQGSVYFSGQCKLINGQIAGAWIIAVSYRVFRICLVGFAEEEGGRHAHLAMVFT